jgi:hypothetical protein
MRDVPSQADSLIQPIWTNAYLYQFLFPENWAPSLPLSTLCMNVPLTVPHKAINAVEDTSPFFPSIPPRPKYFPPALSRRHPILIKHNPANRSGISEPILPYLNLFSLTDLLSGKVCSTPCSYDIFFCHARPYIVWMTDVARGQKYDHPHTQEAKNDFLSHDTLLTELNQKLSSGHKRPYSPLNNCEPK